MLSVRVVLAVLSLLLAVICSRMGNHFAGYINAATLGFNLFPLWDSLLTGRKVR